MSFLKIVFGIVCSSHLQRSSIRQPFSNSTARVALIPSEEFTDQFLLLKPILEFRHRNQYLLTRGCPLARALIVYTGSALPVFDALLNIF